MLLKQGEYDNVRAYFQNWPPAGDHFDDRSMCEIQLYTDLEWTPDDRASQPGLTFSNDNASIGIYAGWDPGSVRKAAELPIAASKKLPTALVFFSAGIEKCHHLTAPLGRQCILDTFKEIFDVRKRGSAFAFEGKPLPNSGDDQIGIEINDAGIGW